VQVDPIKPTLKASGTKPLTLRSDEPLSNVAFNFNLRSYNTVGYWAASNISDLQRMTEKSVNKRCYGRGLHSLPSKLNLRTFGNTSLP
jgi:hypothetical protein